MDQYHLTGKRHSRRAVRVEELDDITHADNLAAAAKTLGPEASIIELKKMEWRMGLRMFIREISDPCDDPFDPGVKWKKLTVADFEDGMAKFFTTKDVAVLEAMYRDYHEIAADEIETIMGKGMSVSAG